MSDIQMSDSQMSAMTIVDNQMTTANSMDTNPSNVQANSVGVNNIEHSLAEALGVRISLEDDIHMSGATDNAIQASTANTGESRQGIAKTFGIQMGLGDTSDIQMSGATDGDIQANTANVDSIRQSIGEASDIQVSSGAGEDDDQVSYISVGELEQGIMDAFKVPESGEAIDNVQTSWDDPKIRVDSASEQCSDQYDNSGVQQAAWEAGISSTRESNVQTGTASAGDIQQSAGQAGAGLAVEDAASGSLPKGTLDSPHPGVQAFPPFARSLPINSHDSPHPPFINSHHPTLSSPTCTHQSTGYMLTDKWHYRYEEKQIDKETNQEEGGEEGFGGLLGCQVLEGGQGGESGEGCAA
jgi:hypothetical protein